MSVGRRFNKRRRESYVSLILTIFRIILCHCPPSPPDACLQPPPPPPTTDFRSAGSGVPGHLALLELSWQYAETGSRLPLSAIFSIYIMLNQQCTTFWCWTFLFQWLKRQYFTNSVYLVLHVRQVTDFLNSVKPHLSFELILDNQLKQVTNNIYETPRH